MNILVVDDREKIGEMVRANLPQRSNHIQVNQVPDISEATDAIEALRPQIVIVQDRLPSGSGLVVIHQVKSHLPDAKVILLMEMDDRNTKKAAMLLGVDHFCNTEDEEDDEELIRIVTGCVEACAQTA